MYSQMAESSQKRNWEGWCWSVAHHLVTVKSDRWCTTSTRSCWWWWLCYYCYYYCYYYYRYYRYCCWWLCYYCYYYYRYYRCCCCSCYSCCSCYYYILPPPPLLDYRHHSFANILSSTGHENNIAQSKLDTFLIIFHRFSSFICCLSVALCLNKGH